MFATAAAAAGRSSLTAHSSARRRSSSRLICEISPKQRLVALRELHVLGGELGQRLGDVDHPAAAGEVDRQVGVGAVQLAPPAAAPLARAAP